MTIKETFIIAAFLTSASVGCAADIPQTKLTFMLMDENHVSLNNVPLHVVTLDRIEHGEGFGNSVYKESNVLTDTNGLAIITWTSADGQISYVTKGLAKYYDGGGLYW